MINAIRTFRFKTSIKNFDLLHWKWLVYFVVKSFTVNYEVFYDYQQ